MITVLGTSVEIGTAGVSLVSGLIGAGIGAAASILATIIANRSNSRIARESRQMEEAAQARQFEFDNLLYLQVAAQNVMRQASRVAMERQKCNSVDDATAEQFRIAAEQFMFYSNRTIDDDLREQCDEFRHYCHDAADKKNLFSDEDALNTLFDLYETTTGRIAERIRELQREKLDPAGK